jgi:hypothetical protein
MMSPLRFAQIRRSTIAQFRTHAGLALYEICARYKDNPSHLTSKQHWHWWLPVLSGKPAPKEIKTQFRFFNRDTLKPAVEEVNEVSELIVRVIEIKVGRTIEFIQFEVQLKPEVSAKSVKALDLSKVAKAHQLGIDSEIAEDLYIRHGELAFSKAIERLEARLAMPGPPVLSRHAYLKSLLVGKVLDTPKPYLAPEKDVAEAATAVVNPVFEKQASFQERESERVKAVRAEIEALDKVSLEHLLGRLKQQFVERQMSAPVMKRLEEGKWQSALILGELIRCYWKQTRGTDWTSIEELPVAERVEQAGLF